MIYIAAPYSHPDKSVIQQRMEVVYRVIADYSRQKIHTISPLFMHEIAIRHDLDGSFDFWNNFCLDLLKRCDKMVVVMLPGWETSTGVKEEIKFCLEHNIEVAYLEVA